VQVVGADSVGGGLLSGDRPGTATGGGPRSGPGRPPTADHDRCCAAPGRHAERYLSLPGLGPVRGARAYYQQLHERGTGHQAALRQLSNRLVGILHGCLKTSTAYNETTAWAHLQPTS
jgi:hypothetical protein